MSCFARYGTVTLRPRHGFNCADSIDPGFDSVASIGASRAAHFTNVYLLFDGYHRHSVQLACLGEGFLFTLGERREDQGL
jgi:hypothetical protein